MKILVTGANNYIGACCAAELRVRHDVCLLLEDGQTAAFGLESSTDVVRGDPADPDCLRRATAGCATVVACGWLGPGASADELERLNIFGIENLLRAARGAGVRKVVYLSTPEALGPSDRGGGGPLDESATPMGREWVDHYQRTATIADHLVRDAVVHGFPLVIVYPGLLYGPGLQPRASWLMRYLHELVEGRVVALVGNPHRRWSLAFGPEVAAGVARVVERGRIGARYILGGVDVELGALFTELEKLGVRLPRWHLSDRTADWLLPPATPWLRAAGRTGHLDPALRDAMRHEWSYSSALAGAELGYSCRPLAEGLEQTVAWLRGQEPVQD